MWLAALSRGSSWLSVETRLPKGNFYKVHGKGISTNFNIYWLVKWVFVSAFKWVDGKKGTGHVGLHRKKVKLFSNSIPESFRQDIGEEQIKQDIGVENKILNASHSGLFPPSYSWMLAVTEYPWGMLCSQGSPRGPLPASSQMLP